MTAIDIIKNLNWKTIFESNNQIQNLLDFISRKISLKDFQNKFHSRSKNKKIIICLTKSKEKLFIKHSMKIYNLANIGLFKNGDEYDNIKEYISSLK